METRKYKCTLFVQVDRFKAITFWYVYTKKNSLFLFFMYFRLEFVDFPHDYNTCFYAYGT